MVSPAGRSYAITLMLVGKSKTRTSKIPSPFGYAAKSLTYSQPCHFLAQLSGLTLGLSIAGAVFLNLAQNDLFAILTNVPRQDIQQLVSGTSSALFASLSPDVREQALGVIVNALRTTCVFPVSMPPGNSRVVLILADLCERRFVGGYAAGAAAFVCAVFMNVSIHLFSTPSPPDHRLIGIFDSTGELSCLRARLGSPGRTWLVS